MAWIIRVKFNNGAFYCNDKGCPVSELKRAFRWENKVDAKNALEKWKTWFGSEAKVKIIEIN